VNLKPLDFSVSVPTDWLLQQNVKPWADIPLWLPRTNMFLDTFKSRRDLGFKSTPTAKALADATDAFKKEGRLPKTGITFETEEKIINSL
jgi:hypothetical protein